MDRAAPTETWKEIWMAITQNPMLSQQYDQGKIFDYLAELGGAKNIDLFKITPAAQGAIDGGLQSGNIAAAWTRSSRSASYSRPYKRCRQREAALAACELVSQEGIVLAALGQFLRAREICAEKTVSPDLTTDDGVRKTLRIQGQASGIMLCIEMIF